MTHRIGTIVRLSLLALLVRAGVAQSQDMRNIVALPAFADVPAPPPSVKDAVARYGDVPTPDGTEKGDLESEQVRLRINGWLKPVGGPTPPPDLGMMRSGGRMTPAAGQAIGQLAQEMGRMTGELTQTIQTYGTTTMPPLRAAYEAKLKKIFDEYNPRIERCLSLHERAGGSSCADPTPERDAAINAAGDAFLKHADSVYAIYKDKLRLISAQGEAAVGHATKALGGSPPPMVQTQIRGVRQNELNALLAALTAETDLIVYVNDHAALPKKTKHGPQ